MKCNMLVLTLSVSLAAFVGMPGQTSQTWGAERTGRAGVRGQSSSPTAEDVVAEYRNFAVNGLGMSEARADAVTRQTVDIARFSGLDPAYAGGYVLILILYILLVVIGPR